MSPRGTVEYMKGDSLSRRISRGKDGVGVWSNDWRNTGNEPIAAKEMKEVSPLEVLRMGFIKYTVILKPAGEAPHD